MLTKFFSSDVIYRTILTAVILFTLELKFTYMLTQSFCSFFMSSMLLRANFEIYREINKKRRGRQSMFGLKCAGFLLTFKFHVNYLARHFHMN